MTVLTMSNSRHAQNMYLCYDPQTKNGVMIDPGGDLDAIISQIDKLGIDLQAILLTHGHYDHIGAVLDLKSETGAQVFSHPAEAALLADPAQNLSERTGQAISIVPDGHIVHNQGKLCGTRLLALHTPGHTAGGLCFFDAAAGIVFTGDTLFFESVGRTDFPTSAQAEISHSITSKLFALPDSTVVYAGHGQPSSIGHEKVHNPYVR